MQFVNSVFDPVLEMASTVGSARAEKLDSLRGTSPAAPEASFEFGNADSAMPWNHGDGSSAGGGSTVDLIVPMSAWSQAPTAALGPLVPAPTPDVDNGQHGLHDLSVVPETDGPATGGLSATFVTADSASAPAPPGGEPLRQLSSRGSGHTPFLPDLRVLPSMNVELDDSVPLQ